MGWSAQDLADQCSRLGHPIPRNVIANMESGRRANLPLVDVLRHPKAEPSGEVQNVTVGP